MHYNNAIADWGQSTGWRGWALCHEAGGSLLVGASESEVYREGCLGELASQDHSHTL